MTPTVDDLIETVKKLASDIDSLEDKVKSLNRDSHDLNKTIKLTKEFHQELSILNNLSESQPRVSLISALQDEIKQIHHLENENSELKIAIEQHQQVLEIVMLKYREQSKQLDRINKLESVYEMPKSDLTSQRYSYFQEKVSELALVMDQACLTDDERIEKNQQHIANIIGENNRIKKMLLHR